MDFHRATIYSKRPIPEVCGSLRLDPELLDDRQPFLGIGLHHRAERLRRLPFTGKNVKSEIGEARSHGGIGECLHGRRIELADDVPRCAPGYENPRQEEIDSAGSPISAKVGMSGATATRVSLVTA